MNLEDESRTDQINDMGIHFGIFNIADLPPSQWEIMDTENHLPRILALCEEIKKNGFDENFPISFMIFNSQIYCMGGSRLVLQIAIRTIYATALNIFLLHFMPIITLNIADIIRI